MQLLDPFEIDDRHHADLEIGVARDIDLVSDDRAVQPFIEEHVGIGRQFVPIGEGSRRYAEDRRLVLVMGVMPIMARAGLAIFAKQRFELGEQIGVPVYSEEGNQNPVQIASNAIKEAKLKEFDTVIVDTAGRLAVDEEMMNEIAKLKKELQPQEVLFVVDSMTGQDAVNTSKAFNERLDFDGVVLTKLDGDTRGGAALSIKYEVSKPIKFVSMGEKLDQIDIFYPERMAQRILGMGDIVSLVEKAQEQFDAQEAERLQKKIRKNQFDFNDFLQQLGQIKKMGNVKDLMAMIPGMGKAMKDIDIDNDSFKKIEAIILSMTPAERENPELLNGSRRKRISSGSGNSVQELNQFIKQFDEMRKMMKTFNKMSTMKRPMSGLPTRK